MNLHALQKQNASVAYMSMEIESANNFKAVYSKQEAHWTRHWVCTHGWVGRGKFPKFLLLM